MANKSHLAFEKAIQAGSFQVFKRTMKPIVRTYDNLYKKPLWWRALSRIKKYLNR